MIAEAEARVLSQATQSALHIGLWHGAGCEYSCVGWWSVGCISRFVGQNSQI